MKVLYVLIGVCLALCGCASVNNDTQQKTTQALSPQYDSVYHLKDKYPEKIEIRYAKGLKVKYQADGVHVFISNPENGKSGVQEIVVPQKGKKDTRFICTTALQLGNFEILGLENHIVGINSLKNIFSKTILNQIAIGTTMRVGKEGNFDLETVIATKPDYIFVSASKYGGFEALKDCGIPLVQHHGYKETDPLGQAEWIKLTGLLTGETQRANAVFDYIEKEYLALKAKVAKATDANVSASILIPTVLSGRQLRDGWYVMGGKSYMATLFRDAGAKYIMDYLPNTGGTTLDFETVYAKGINADFWQTDGSFDEVFTLEDLATEDVRYADIKAFKEHKVLFCNLTKKPYRELAGMEPHVMLADFVKAFHPELIPNYTPKYYEFLK